MNKWTVDFLNTFMGLFFAALILYLVWMFGTEVLAAFVIRPIFYIVWNLFSITLAILVIIAVGWDWLELLCSKYRGKK